MFSLKNLLQASKRVLNAVKDKALAVVGIVTAGVVGAVASAHDAMAALPLSVAPRLQPFKPMVKQSSIWCFRSLVCCSA